MLPDSPKIKAIQCKLLRRFMKNVQQKELGFFAQAPHFVLHEGKKWTVIREDGSSETSSVKRHSSQTRSLTNSEVESLTLEKLLWLYGETARELTSEMKRTFFGVVDRAAEEIGNVVKGQGRPTALTILDCLRKLEISFTNTGQPILPTLVCAPEMKLKLEAAFREIFETPEFRQQIDQIVVEKREASRDREANRKLVG